MERIYREDWSFYKKVLWWIRETFFYIFFYLPMFPICFIFFRLICRVKVKGKKPNKFLKNALIMVNHQSNLDVLLVGYFFFPRPMWYPAKIELFKVPIFKNLLVILRAFPVKRGQRDFKAMRTMSELAKKFLVCVFPEGTRTRDGNIQQGRPGAGKVILDAGVPVIPVYVHNLYKMLPRGAKFPNLKVKIGIAFGEPIKFDSYYDSKNLKETSIKVINEVMDRIRELRDRYFPES